MRRFRRLLVVVETFDNRIFTWPSNLNVERRARAGRAAERQRDRAPPAREERPSACENAESRRALPARSAGPGAPPRSSQGEVVISEVSPGSHFHPLSLRQLSPRGGHAASLVVCGRTCGSSGLRGRPEGRPPTRDRCSETYSHTTNAESSETLCNDDDDSRSRSSLAWLACGGSKQE